MSSVIRWFAAAPLFAAAFAFAGLAQAQELPTPDAPAGSSVKWLQPADGAKVKSPVALKFVAEGIKTEPAGAVIAGSGHHHVIIDASVPRKGRPIPNDAQNLHFGKAQTEATVELAPGKHELTLQFADGLHRSYGPQLSATITIEVVP
jgi:hypothetical protein